MCLWGRLWHHYCGVREASWSVDRHTDWRRWKCCSGSEGLAGWVIWLAPAVCNRLSVAGFRGVAGCVQGLAPERRAH